MTNNGSLVKTELGEVNPYILDDETRYKLKVTHYTLDGTEYRKIQEKAHERKLNLQKMIKELDVDVKIQLTSVEDILKSTEFKLQYFQKKDVIDKAFKTALTTCTMQDIVNYLTDYINNKNS